MAGLQHRQGRVRAAFLAFPIALAIALGGCTDQDGTAPEAPAAEPTSAQSPANEKPVIGQGDPMLGITDGMDRPELADLETDDLDPTNAQETAERFRRLFEDESTSTEEWVASLSEVSDPTFAASLPLAERGYFKSAHSSTVEIEEGYALGNSRPYATIAAVDEGGNPLWRMRLSFTANKADPSVGTWKVISVDWEDRSLVKDKAVPLTEGQRDDLRVTAAMASSPVLSQAQGETGEDREATLKRYLSDPEHAMKMGKPVPNKDVAVQARDPESSYFVTRAGDTSVWVELNTGYQEIGGGEEVAQGDATIYVELTPSGDTFRAKDVYSADEFAKVAGK